MEKKDTDLLLKDLCARLPYGVMLSVTHNKYTDETFNARLSTIDYCGEIKVRYGFEEYEQVFSLEQIKPYLFPLSSMTERQCYELASIRSGFQDCWKYIKTPIPLSICNFEQIEWFHKNHLDYRGLIPMGLAIDATGLNIY